MREHDVGPKARHFHVGGVIGKPKPILLGAKRHSAIGSRLGGGPIPRGARPHDLSLCAPKRLAVCPLGVGVIAPTHDAAQIPFQTGPHLPAIGRGAREGLEHLSEGASIAIVTGVPGLTHHRGPPRLTPRIGVVAINRLAHHQPPGGDCAGVAKRLDTFTLEAEGCIQGGAVIGHHVDVVKKCERSLRLRPIICRYRRRKFPPMGKKGILERPHRLGVILELLRRCAILPVHVQPIGPQRLQSGNHRSHKRGAMRITHRLPKRLAFLGASIGHDLQMQCGMMRRPQLFESPKGRRVPLRNVEHIGPILLHHFTRRRPIADHQHFRERGKARWLLLPESEKVRLRVGANPMPEGIDAVDTVRRGIRKRLSRVNRFPHPNIPREFHREGGLRRNAHLRVHHHPKRIPRLQRCIDPVIERQREIRRLCRPILPAQTLRSRLSRLTEMRQGIAEGLADRTLICRRCRRRRLPEKTETREVIRRAMLQPKPHRKAHRMLPCRRHQPPKTQHRLLPCSTRQPRMHTHHLHRLRTKWPHDQCHHETKHSSTHMLLLPFPNVDSDSNILSS